MRRRRRSAKQRRPPENFITVVRDGSEVKTAGGFADLDATPKTGASGRGQSRRIGSPFQTERMGVSGRMLQIRGARTAAGIAVEEPPARIFLARRIALAILRAQPMSESRPQFDPVRYKTTTRAQWDDAAAAWHHWGPLLESWLGPATETMLDMAGIGPGSHVLDVAAGAGGQTLAAARRVGQNGRVLATDLSSAILELASQQARSAGLPQIETRQLDGEHLDELDSGSFDAVISRVGMIYFPDQHTALSGMRSALRTGGRCAAMVYSTADENGFFSLPVSIIRRRAALPPPLPGQPGPFSLGGEGVLESAFTRAGFTDVQSVRIDAPVRLPSATECLSFERESFGALHQMLSSLPDGEKQAAWDEIEQELRQFEGGGGFVGPCELVVAAGARAG